MSFLYISVLTFSQMAGAAASQDKWLEYGTVCGVGLKKTEAIINLNKEFNKSIIRLEGDWNSYTGADSLHSYLKGPFKPQGEITHRKETLMGFDHRFIACQLVKGKKPMVDADESPMKGKYVCERNDNNTNVAISFVNNKLTYTDSFNNQKNCEKVPGYSSVEVFSCLGKNETTSRQQASFVYLDRDTLEITVSSYYSARNVFTESFKAQCQTRKQINY